MIPARLKPKSIAALIGLAAPLAYAVFLLSGCVSPLTQTALVASAQFSTAAQFADNDSRLIMPDGGRLRLQVWPSQTPEPEHVVVAVHGMNNSSFEASLAAQYWAARGVTTYAYDQRGFGGSQGRGVWPDEELMRQDLRDTVALVRARHPKATITVMGISMGAAVCITAFASDDPPDADRLIASGPGLRGWGAMNPLYASSLWMSAHTRPAWIVTVPRFATVWPTDNKDYLRAQAEDGMYLEDNRIDQVYGVVSLMENAHDAVDRLPPDLPVLMSYGANDAVIPENGPRRTARRLPDHVRTVYYEDGYHMLLSDLQRERVFDDYLAFMTAPDTPLPSDAPEWPFRPR
jgi:acylglycerol lipase